MPQLIVAETARYVRSDYEPKIRDGIWGYGVAWAE
jgi:hypothetical protein